MPNARLAALGVLALAFVLVPLSAVAELPGERRLKEALGFDYGDERACVKVAGRGPAGRWREEPPLPSLRDEARAVVAGGGVFIAGGLASADPPAGQSVATFERYDLAQRRYERLADLPTPLNHVGLVEHGGDIYLLGGLREESGRVVATNRAFRYRVADGRWEELARMRHRRGAHATAVVGQEIFVFGGRRDETFGGDPEVAPVEAFDTETGRWRTLDDMPQPRDHLAAAVHDGRVYVLGGRVADATPQARLDRYDTGSDRWTRLPDPPMATSGIDLVAAGDRLVTAGGEDPPGGRVLGDVWGYAPEAGRWTRLPPLPSPRHGYASVVAGERLYVFGGSTCPGFQPTGAVASLPVEGR